VRGDDARGAHVDGHGGPLIARGPRLNVAPERRGASQRSRDPPLATVRRRAIRPLRSLARATALGLVLGIGASLVTAARAQVSASVSVVSDYRFRGISLSDDRPAVQGSVAWDHPGGWYAGAFASTIDAQFLAAKYEGVLYAGFASRLVGDASWDAGVSYATFPRSSEYDYLEAYVGLSASRLSARVHYSPDYFGQGVPSVYGEVNGAWPLGDRLNLLAHIGALRARHPAQYAVQGKTVRVDGRVGLALDMRWATLQLAWVRGDTAAALYPVDREGRRNTLVVSLSRAF